MFKLCFRSSQPAQPSTFVLYRQANRVAQTNPELAMQLRMQAAYGNTLPVKDKGTRKPVPVVAQKQPHIEVRTPRIFARQLAV